MRKFLVFLCVVGLTVSSASPLFAGGIVNKQNFSVEYLRTFSRNAATDAADVVVFNPAGVMKMENGAYGNLGIFSAAKDYNNEILGTDHDSDEPSIIPGLFALYKQDKWAGFFAFTIPGGGGMVDFKDGNARTYELGNGLIANANSQLDAAAPILALLGIPDPSLVYYSAITNQSLEADSFYYGFTLGGSYAINDKVAVAAGLRFIDAYKEFKGTVTFSAAGSILGTIPGINDDVTANVDLEQTADGWGGFLGVNISPTEALNFGFRFETATKLDFKNDVKTDNLGITPAIGFADGSKYREDLPGLLGLGVSYRINPKFKVDLSYTYYLEKSAKWEDRLEDEGDSYDLAISVEYTINPRLKASLGYMLTNTNIDADHMLPEAPELDANTFCSGLSWQPMDNLTLNFALMTTIYDSDTRSDGIKLEKSIVGAGIGVQYKFM